MQAGIRRARGPASRWQPWPRAAGLAAFAAPLLMWAEFIGHGLARPGYNLLTRAASDLGARGAPAATPFTIGFFFVPGLLTALLGVGLWGAIRAGWAWRTGAVLVVVEGILLVLMGAFPEDPTSTSATLVHQHVATAGFTAAMLAPLVLPWGVPARTSFGPPRRVWVLCGAILAVIQVAGMVIGAVAPLPAGLVQRPFGLVLTVWFVSAGTWLLRPPTS